MHYGDYDGVSDKALVFGLLAALVLGVLYFLGFFGAIAWSIFRHH
jgi:hypothetical protein